MKKNVVIFASGSGSNAENIINYFRHHPTIQIVEIISNNPNAYVLERAKRLEISTFLINRFSLYESNQVIDHLISLQTDLIVLAGFLWLIPSSLIEKFPRKIINIHPALLPNYGGKGMYGDRVHQTVLKNHEKESGITIHYVNEHFDEGEIIFQKKCLIDSNETASSLAEKIHQLEHVYYPAVIEKVIENIN